MRRQTRIAGTVVGAAIFLLLVLLALTSKKAEAIALLISTNGPTARQSQGLYTAILTNSTDFPVYLHPVLVQLEDGNGKVLNNYGETWADGAGKQLGILPAKGSASISPQFNPTTKRIRIVGEYSCYAGALPRALSRGIRKLPLNFLPGNVLDWLRNHGFVDGIVRGKAESPWLPISVNGTNRRPGSEQGEPKGLHGFLYPRNPSDRFHSFAVDPIQSA